MRKSLTLLVIFCYSLPSAQGQETQNTNRQSVDRSTGSLLYISQTAMIKGSQFISDEWLPGYVIADNGIAYKNLRIKLDAYNNKVVFNRNDTAFEVVPPAKEVQLFSTGNTTDTLVFRNGYSLSAKIKPGVYLQVLAEGKITLLKFIQKDVEEYTEYSDATKYKRFTEMYRYYTYTGDRYQEIKISKKGLEDLLTDKWQAVSAYLSQQKLNAKDEKSWAMAIKYYNTL